ncbi:hypothetical protein J3D47_003010 [Pseudomonas laurylsulfativorans]|uniref:hypothetical protein n=1 Tax=Pseudomonas laurylsulfativorans TaxID=1943631 RepID=UPI0020A0CFB8|nr:hypothetical protein [Pseudomonas laurylsulfativorans]MCP1418767.1 hypothetical protein [Pseudomonas laurylsulfativorans]
MKGCKLLIIAFLALITNGFSLLGVGQGSIGGVARAMEANHNIARNIETAKAMGLLAGNPPVRNDGVAFGPFQVDCSAIGMCGVLA